MVFLLGSLFFVSHCFAMNDLYRQIQEKNEYFNHIRMAIDNGNDEQALALISNEKMQQLFTPLASDNPHVIRKGPLLLCDAIKKECDSSAEGSSRVAKALKDFCSSYQESALLQCALDYDRDHMVITEQHRMSICQRMIKVYGVSVTTKDLDPTSKSLKELKQLALPVVVLQRQLQDVCSAIGRQIWDLDPFIESEHLKQALSADKNLAKNLFEWLIEKNDQFRVHRILQESIEVPDTIDPQIVKSAPCDMQQVLKLLLAENCKQ